MNCYYLFIHKNKIGLILSHKRVIYLLFYWNQYIIITNLEYRQKLYYSAKMVYLFFGNHFYPTISKFSK